MLLIPVMRFQWRVWLTEISLYWQCQTKFKQALCVSCFLAWCGQRRTQKFCMGGFIQWLMVAKFGVRSLWRHNLKSYLIFQSNDLAKFVDVICMLFYHTHSPYFMCHCTEYKLSAIKVRISEENKLNSTTRVARWPVFIKLNALASLSVNTLLPTRIADIAYV